MALVVTLTEIITVNITHMSIGNYAGGHKLYRLNPIPTSALFSGSVLSIALQNQKCSLLFIR